MEKVSNELDYSTKVSNHSTINYRDVPPQNSQTVTLSPNGTVGPTEFILSSSVFNPSKTKLQFKLSIAASSNSTKNLLSANLLKTISRLVVYDSGTNALLVDINNFDKYSDMMEYSVSKEELKKKAFLKNKAPPVNLASAILKTVEERQRDNTLTDDGNRLYGKTLDGTGLASNNLIPVGDEELDSPLFTYESATVSTGIVVDVSIPLSAFKGTILAQDNLIYSPTNIVIQIYWNATNQFACKPIAVLTGVGTAVGTTTISQLNMSMAIESNLSITSKVISKVMGEGISFNTPYASVIKQSMSSRAHAFSLQITRAYGNRILFIMVAKFGQSPFQLGERAIGNVTRYQTTLNSIPIKYPKGFDCTRGEHYTLGNKAYIENSLIQSRTLYNQRFCHIDSFFGERSLCDIDYNDVDGLDVSSQSSVYGWDASLATESAADYHIIVMGHKVITFTSMGATIQ